MPDYKMVSVHGGNGAAHGSEDVISQAVLDRAAADRHWIVIPCGNSTVRVGFDIRIWGAEPPSGDEAGFDREYRFTVGFPEGELVVDQGTMGTAGQIDLPQAGTYHVRLRSWNQDLVMREAEAIEDQADDEDWDIYYQREMLERLDGKEHYALDLWPAG